MTTADDYYSIIGMKKTIGIVAHVDAGKTSLSEQILYLGGAIRTVGRVDKKSSFLDFNEIEKERGITVFSESAGFTIGENTFYLLDTPGHADFAAETERAIKAIDFAILTLSAVEGVQSHTVTLWNILKKNGIPVFVFINKTDRQGADVQKVLSQLKEEFGDGFIICENLNDAAEEIACLDDELTEEYLENGFTEEKFIPACRKLIKDRKLFPVFKGCALSGEGIKEFLSSLDELTETEYNPDGEFSAFVWKVRRNKTERTVFLKILSGTLKAKDIIDGEKVNEIRLYSGNKSTPVGEVSAGDVCAVSGLLKAKSGCFIGENKREAEFSAIPALYAKAEFDSDKDPVKILEYFKILEDEEPTLSVKWNERIKEITVRVMGTVELEVLSDTLSKRFGENITFGEPNIVYMETIKGKSHGAGHYEPLKHYAEVHFLLEEAPRGSGITFESKVSTDELSLNWQRLIETHIFEKEHVGALTGFPITDIKFTLTAGRSHLKHTEGGDFRKAVYAAVRQGLFKAESVLLEPWYKFRIQVPMEFTGRVLSDITKMSGEFSPPETHGDKTVISGVCPLSEIMNYGRELAAFTSGKGVFFGSLTGYRECHNSAEVIEKIGYDKERDKENSADSVFCSHGAGFLVKWYEADEYMHCK